MKTLRDVRTILVFSAILIGVIATLVACGDGGADLPLHGYAPYVPSSDGLGGSGGTTGAGSSASAETLYRGLEKDFIGRCGGPAGGCHVSATTFAFAPKFLAGPDSYKSVKGYQGIVGKDASASIIVLKGVHEGGSIYAGADPDAGTSFGKRIEAWLTQESVELLAIKPPTTDPFSVTVGGSNDVDLSKLATGVTGVHLTFSAKMVGTSLEITNIALVTAAGSGVHLQHPIFYRVPATKPNPADPDIADPQDTFSNTDITVAGAATTSMPIPFAIFSGFGPWGKTDKLRIEAGKLESGTVAQAAVEALCSNPTNFQNMVVPSLTGGGNSAPLNCLNCHDTGGGGNGALNLSGLGATKDYPGACAAVLNKIDVGTPANSKIIHQVDGTLAHGGGSVSNPAGWQNDWKGFITGGTIF